MTEDERDWSLQQLTPAKCFDPVVGSILTSVLQENRELKLRILTMQERLNRMGEDSIQ